MEEVVRITGDGLGVTASGRRARLATPGDLLAPDGAVTPGPHHQAPPCRHFPECGGCQLQHVDAAAYAAFLRDRVAGALSAQGLAGVEISPPHLSPPNSRRRAALHAERRGGRVLLGFREERSRRIVDMRECHILRPELFALVGPLRDLMRGVLSERESATVRLTLADGGADVLIEGPAPDGLAATEALTRFAEARGLVRLAIDDGGGPQDWWTPRPCTVTLGGAAVALPHGAFLQATEDGEAALVAAVRDAVAGAPTVLDLFAGLGTFALALPARVLAVEGALDAALALKAAAARAGRPVAVEHRDLFRRPLVVAELARFDAVVLDPPRAGAKEQAAELARSGVPRITYASCNPATFARDARTLVDGSYRLEWVRPVGQFRWSTHVELAAAFTR